MAMGKTPKPRIIKPDVVEVRIKVHYIRTHKIRRYAMTSYVVILGEDTEMLSEAPPLSGEDIAVTRQLVSGTNILYDEDPLLTARFFVAVSTNVYVFKTSQPLLTVEQELEGGTNINNIEVD